MPLLTACVPVQLGILPVFDPVGMPTGSIRQPHRLGIFTSALLGSIHPALTHYGEIPLEFLEAYVCKHKVPGSMSDRCGITPLASKPSRTGTAPAPTP